MKMFTFPFHYLLYNYFTSNMCRGGIGLFKGFPIITAINDEIKQYKCALKCLLVRI